MSTARIFTKMVSAPVFGLWADRVGWRRFQLFGILTLGLAISTAVVAVNASFLPAVQVTVVLGTSMLLPALVARFLADIGSHWLVGLAAGLYFGITQVAASTTTVGASLLIKKMGVTSGVTTIAFILFAGALLGMSFIALSYLARRHYAWRDEWRGLRDGGVTPSNVAKTLLLLLLVSFSISTITVFLKAYAERLGVQSVELVAVLMFFTAASLVCFFSGPLSDLIDWLTFSFLQRKYGKQSLTVLGALMLCSGLAMMLLARSAEDLKTAAVLAGLGVGIIGPPLFVMVLTSLPHHLWGTATGLYLAVDELGYLLGRWISGLAADRVGLSSPFVLGLAAAMASLVVTLVVARRPPMAEEH